jgi:ABC-2 type transport system permease protein
MKFITLLKKELTGLINATFIITLVAMFAIFYGLGDVIGGASEDLMESAGTVTIADLDQTDFSKSVITSLEEKGYKVEQKTITQAQADDPATTLNDFDINALLILPKGFTEDVQVNHQFSNVITFAKVDGSGVFSNLSSTVSSGAVSDIQAIIRNKVLIDGGYTEEELNFLNTPVIANEFTVVSDKSANISAESILSFITSQTIVIPLAVFMLVMFTSQMMISAISTEKIDKTLETLLSTPISRMSIIWAKMLAATVIALLSAVVYMLGFQNYMDGIMGSAMEAEVSNIAGQGMRMQDVLKDLGISVDITGYLLIGLQIVFTLLIALCVSLMLGALVTDPKSAQTLSLPVMFAVMIPFMASIFVNSPSLPLVGKGLLYLLPFTHTMMAMNNVMFGNMSLYWFGLIYQILFFAICMFFCLKLFTSDKILTISLNFGQKKKFKNGE